MAATSSTTDTRTLEQLMDSGFSRHFTVQFSHSYDIGDEDIVVFDDEDRQHWGETPMSFDPQILVSGAGLPVSGYASAWVGGHHRLICVAKDNLG